jgi:hypothetical protein
MELVHLKPGAANLDDLIATRVKKFQALERRIIGPEVYLNFTDRSVLYKMFGK